MKSFASWNTIALIFDVMFLPFHQNELIKCDSMFNIIIKVAG